MRRRSRPSAPEWTDENDSDPGVTLLELFAFLGETLDYLQEPKSRKRSQHRRLAAATLFLVAVWRLRAKRGE